MNDKIALRMILAAALLLGAAAGCAKKPSEDEKILAKVSNTKITLKEFKSRLAKVPAHYKTVIEKNKKRYLDEMIMEMLLYEEAVRNGLERDAEVREVVSEAKKKVLIAKFIKNEVEDKIKVSDAEMKQFYEAKKENFKTPPLWRASHILVSNEREARDILTELSKGADFAELAKSRSMDATASRGGDVGYFKTGQLVPEFEQECLRLNPGQTSGVVKTQFGYHIIRVTDKKEPAVEPYDKVKRVIENELKKQKRSELFDKLVLSLKEKYGVEIREDVFRSLESIDKEKEQLAKK